MQEVTGNLEVLEAGQRQLGELKSSLELELSQRQQTLDILRGLITQQVVLCHLEMFMLACLCC